MMKCILLAYAAVVVTLADRIGKDEASARDVPLVSSEDLPAHLQSNALYHHHHHHRHLHGHSPPGTSKVAVAASHRASLLSRSLPPNGQKPQRSDGTRHETSLLSSSAGVELALGQTSDVHDASVEDSSSLFGDAWAYITGATEGKHERKQIVTPVHPADVRTDGSHGRSENPVVPALSLVSLADTRHRGDAPTPSEVSLLSVHALTSDLISAHRRNPSLWPAIPSSPRRKGRSTRHRGKGMKRPKRPRMKNAWTRVGVALMENDAEGGDVKDDNEEKKMKASVKKHTNEGKDKHEVDETEEEEEDGNKKDEDEEVDETEDEEEDGKKMDEEKEKKKEKKEKKEKKDEDEDEDEHEDEDEDEDEDEEKVEKKKKDDDEDEGKGRGGHDEATGAQKDGDVKHDKEEEKGKAGDAKGSKKNITKGKADGIKIDKNGNKNVTQNANAKGRNKKKKKTRWSIRAALDTIKKNVKWLEKEWLNVFFGYHAIALMVVLLVWLSLATYFYYINVLTQKPRLDGPIELLDGGDYTELKCGFLEDIDSFAQACFCPAIRLTDTYVTAGLLKNKPSVLLHIVAIFFCSWSPFFLCLFGCYIPFRHYQVRKALDGASGVNVLLSDCLVVGCCSPCCFHVTIAQEARQVDRAVNVRTEMLFTLEKCEGVVGAPVMLLPGSLGSGSLESVSLGSRPTKSSEKTSQKSKKTSGS